MTVRDFTLVPSVGNAGVRKFDSAGNFIKSFNVGRTDFIDLAADQCTLLYTTENTRFLKRLALGGPACRR